MVFEKKKKDSCIIGEYTLAKLADIDCITIKSTLSDDELANLSYLKNGMTIFLNKNYYVKEEEIAYYRNAKNIIARLSQLPKKFNISVEVDDRETFRQSNILGSLPSNVTLEIINDEIIYKQDEYIKEEARLEQFVANIRQADLSPLEKYMAVYDIVKNFKPYKENEKDPKQSRKLKYILEDDNEYIVCAGYAKMLHELLLKVGIPSKYIHVDVDKTEEDDLTIDYGGHARNIVKIDDDKYHVHGLYIADSTFDNKIHGDLYIHSLFTFDRLKEAKRLEKLNNYDLLMDFHSYEEFEQKLNYYLKFASEQNNHNMSTNTIYKILYLTLLDILSSFDSELTTELYHKYHESLFTNANDIDEKELSQIMPHLIHDYYKFIKPLTNNNIPLKTILEAAANSKEKVSGFTQEEFLNWLKQMLQDNKDYIDFSFPYIYDKHSKEGFLEERKKRG